MNGRKEGASPLMVPVNQRPTTESMGCTVQHSYMHMYDVASRCSLIKWLQDQRAGQENIQDAYNIQDADVDVFTLRVERMDEQTKSFSFLKPIRGLSCKKGQTIFWSSRDKTVKKNKEENKTKGKAPALFCPCASHFAPDSNLFINRSTDKIWMNNNKLPGFAAFTVAWESAGTEAAHRLVRRATTACHGTLCACARVLLHMVRFHGYHQRHVLC